MMAASRAPFVRVYNINGGVFVPTRRRARTRRDSFIAKQERYRWAEPFGLYRDQQARSSSSSSSSRLDNSSDMYKLEETVADYFSGVVLERHGLNGESEAGGGASTLKFQVAFNLAVVWMIVFVSLSKGRSIRRVYLYYTMRERAMQIYCALFASGLRSYGKVVYVLTLVPVFGTLVLSTKLLGLIPPASIHQLFPATVWSEFFINGKSWLAASSEVFLTWGVFGAAAMQVRLYLYLYIFRLLRVFAKLFIIHYYHLTDAGRRSQQAQTLVATRHQPRRRTYHRRSSTLRLFGQHLRPHIATLRILLHDDEFLW